MDFDTLLKRVAPGLKRIARNHNGHGFFIDEDDLYQEMCIYLWDRFRKGACEGVSDSYIVRGCELHVLNVLRKSRRKTVVLSLEEPVGEDGAVLEDNLCSGEEPSDVPVKRRLAVDEAMRESGLTQRERQVFSLLLKGYTVREVGTQVGISHVMVVKIKRRVAEKVKELRSVVLEKNSGRGLPKSRKVYF